MKSRLGSQHMWKHAAQVHAFSERRSSIRREGRTVHVTDGRFVCHCVAIWSPFIPVFGEGTRLVYKVLVDAGAVPPSDQFPWMMQPERPGTSENITKKKFINELVEIAMAPQSFDLPSQSVQPRPTRIAGNAARKRKLF
jgi:hypothetical protein